MIDDVRKLLRSIEQRERRLARLLTMLRSVASEIEAITGPESPEDSTPVSEAPDVALKRAGRGGEYDQQQLDEAVRRAIVSGMNSTQTAAHLGVARCTVSRVRARIGMPGRPGEGRRKRSEAARRSIFAKDPAKLRAEAKRLRKLGLTQKEIGKKLDIAQSLVSTILSGKR